MPCTVSGMKPSLNSSQAAKHLGVPAIKRREQNKQDFLQVGIIYYILPAVTGIMEMFSVIVIQGKSLALVARLCQVPTDAH